jgi:prepilin-type N-terminal cleavage/methylation domain-containing protein
MLERIWKARRDERGFTLIELIMVLVILGILLALALPQYLGTRRKAYVAEADQNLQEMRTQAWTFFLEKNTFAGVADTINPPPESDNWTYAWGTCNATSCQMTATGKGPVLGATVTVTLNNTGQATVDSSGF